MSLLAQQTGKSRDQKILDLSLDFVLSAGTVTIDPAGAAPKILVILENRTKEYLLPKGRKDVGETLAEAAVRETFEETGYVCSLKAHRLHTNATASHSKVPVAEFRHTEPIACQQRIVKSGRRKVIFWYYAEGDSTASKQHGTQDEGEDFTSLWIEAQKAVEMLTFEDDRRIAELALEAMKGRITE